LLLDKDHKSPNGSDHITAIHWNIRQTERLPNQHSGKALPGRVAVRVQFAFVFLEGEIRRFWLPTATGDHAIGFPEQEISIHNAFKFALTKMIESLPFVRKIDQREKWPDKVRV